MITNTSAHLIKATANEVERRKFDFLGVSLLAHRRAIAYGSVIKANMLAEMQQPLTLKRIGITYRAHADTYLEKMAGKALEYAVADLFQRREEPYYTLICDGIYHAITNKKSANVRRTSLGEIDRVQGVHVAQESRDTKRLLDFYRWRVLEQANLSIGGATKKFSRFSQRVDALFCDPEPTNPSQCFALLASIKKNPNDFWPSKHDDTIPIDLAITIATDGDEYADWRAQLRAAVVYLNMHVDQHIYAWENVTKIMDKALRNLEERNYLKAIASLFFPIGSFFLGEEPLDHWVRFLGKRLEKPTEEVLEDIEAELKWTHTERTAILPTMGGPKTDFVLDITE